MTDQLGRDCCTWAARALLAAAFLSAGAGCGGGMAAAGTPPADMAEAATAERPPGRGRRAWPG